MGSMKIKNYKDVIAEAKGKIPREQKDIEKDYSNAAAAVGNQFYLVELERAKLQKLTLAMSEFKDEYHKCIAYNEDKAKKEEALS